MSNKSLAAVLVAVVAASAAPAFADTGSIFGPGYAKDKELVQSFVVRQLQRDGVNASRVAEWNGYIQAFVTLDDGTQTFRYFEPVTLEPVASLNGTN